MTIERQTFDKYVIDPAKLREYGFSPSGDKLVYTRPLPQDDMMIVLTYHEGIEGKILDLTMGEEYLAYRVDDATGYSATIRRKYLDLLEDIRDKCCQNVYYRSPQARRLIDYIQRTYDVSPEFLWDKFPSFAAFRASSGKWFALMGTAPMAKLTLKANSDDKAEVLNVKLDPAVIQSLVAKTGYYPAYHMNKKSWVTVILDDTLSDEELETRIGESFALV